MVYSRYAILNEAWRLVADGILSAQDIDKVMSEGLGMRYAFIGQFEAAHLNAEGNCKNIQNNVHTLNKLLFQVSKNIVKLIIKAFTTQV